MEKLQSIKIGAPVIPKDWCGDVTYKLVNRPTFEFVIFVIVFADIILIIIQLSIVNDLAEVVLRYINCVVVGLYTSEAILKVTCACG